MLLLVRVGITKIGLSWAKQVQVYLINTLYLGSLEEDHVISEYEL